RSRSERVRRRRFPLGLLFPAVSMDPFTENLDSRGVSQVFRRTLKRLGGVAEIPYNLITRAAQQSSGQAGSVVVVHGQTLSNSRSSPADCAPTALSLVKLLVLTRFQPIGRFYMLC